MRPLNERPVDIPYVSYSHLVNKLSYRGYFADFNTNKALRRKQLDAVAKLVRKGIYPRGDNPDAPLKRGAILQLNLYTNTLPFNALETFQYDGLWVVITEVAYNDISDTHTYTVAPMSPLDPDFSGRPLTECRFQHYHFSNAPYTPSLKPPPLPPSLP